MNLFITGGAGFLGRGLLRQIAHDLLPVDNVTIYSRDEGKQYECQRRYPFAHYVLGDVRETDRIAAAMAGHDTVIHMAAMKRIPEAERNAAECVDVNIGGARSVIEAARRARVERVVGISTDKAVQPVNVYGASKMVMERLFAEASDSWTQFTCTRYGNVVGSTGSVVPVFQRQAQEGCVQLTNPKMTRYWMSVDEAIQVIQLALSPATHSGAIVIPQPRAMRLEDVAQAVAPAVPVSIIGERPGEKRHELLLHHEESVRVLRHREYLELLPTDEYPPEAVEPFTLISNNPAHWMSPDEMRELIEDAKEV